MGFEKQDLDYAMVPAGLLAMAAYHAWLLYRIVNYPATTVIGINAINREVWVETIMQDGIKNGVLAVQTLRNNIMASTLLASTAITLSSLIGVLVSGTAGPGAAGALIYGDDSRLGSSIKYFAILACFLVAFVCNVQCVRYYSHVSFLINVPAGKHVAGGHLAEYVSRALNRGSYFWSVGLRAFYFSFPLFLWTFGPIPMLLSSCTLVVLLYFLDTARDFNRTLSVPRGGGAANADVEEGFSPTPSIDSFQIPVARAPSSVYC